MKPGCGYIRVSKEKEEGVSPEQQREKIELQARLMGVDLGHIYQDLDLSGRTDNREDFQSMIRDIKAGKWEVVLLYKLDRFCRNVKDFHRYMEILDQHNCSLVSVSQNFDTSTPTGRLLRNILVDFAQFESEMIGERVRDNKAANARRGRWNGGHTPYGYKVVNKQLIINEEEAQVVRLAFELRSHGYGILAIAKELNLRGYVARRGSSWGIAWSEGTIKHMLQNRVYVGDMIYGDVETLDCFPAIVDREIFNKAQITGRIPNRSQAAQHLLSGLLYCHACHKYGFQIGYNGKKLARRYSCRTKRWQNTAACASPLLDADSLESAIMSTLFNTLSDPSNLESAAAKEMQAHEDNKAVAEDRTPMLEKELARVQRVMRELFSDYYDAHIITREQFVAKNDEYLKQETLLKTKLEEVDQVDQLIDSLHNDVEVFKGGLSLLHDNWEYASPEERRIFLRSLVRSISVYPDHVEVDLFLFKQKIPAAKRIRGTLYF